MSDTCEGDGWVGEMDSNSNGLQCGLEIVRPSRPSSEGCCTLSGVYCVSGTDFHSVCALNNELAMPFGGWI